MKKAMRFGIPIVLILLILSCNSSTERRKDFEVHGIDISHYQSTIDWDTVAQQGIQFAFVKASEGQDLHDSLFCFNWNEMKRVGIKRGAYHFYHPSIPVDLQIQNFKEQVDLSDGDLPPVLDIEVTGGKNEASIVAGVQQWLRAIEDFYQVRPIIYSNYNFYRRYLSKDFEAYPLWIARYSEQEPYLPFGNSWKFWQYGDRGQLAGIEGDVDLNVFHGNAQELERFCRWRPQLLTQVTNSTNN